MSREQKKIKVGFGYKVDKSAMTVTNMLSGIVFRFDTTPKGDLIGVPTDETAHLAENLSTHTLATIARRANDAWAEAQHK